MESPQYAETSVWECVVNTLRMDPMVFVRETNWNVAQWIEEGGVFLDGQLPYKVTDWQSSEGLHVEGASIVRSPVLGVVVVVGAVERRSSDNDSNNCSASLARSSSRAGGL